MLIVNPFASLCLRPVLRLWLVAACLGCITAARVRAQEPTTSDTQTAASQTVDSQAEAADSGTTLDSSSADDAGTSPKKSPRSAGGPTGKRRGNAGRLPPYYASIVDNRQRQAIYEIRTRVAAELEQLQQQLDALRRAEMSEIEALLTPAQHQQLDALRAQRLQPASSPAGT